MDHNRNWATYLAGWIHCYLRIQCYRRCEPLKCIVSGKYYGFRPQGKRNFSSLRMGQIWILPLFQRNLRLETEIEDRLQLPSLGLVLLKILWNWVIKVGISFPWKIILLSMLAFPYLSGTSDGDLCECRPGTPALKHSGMEVPGCCPVQLCLLRVSG